MPNSTATSLFLSLCNSHVSSDYCFLTYPAFEHIPRKVIILFVRTSKVLISSNMQSLLSPAESHAFQSFLSTMDYPDDSITAAEWAVYNSDTSTFAGQDDRHREALTKATKDLMSLDADSWEGGASMMDHQASVPQRVFDAHGHYDPQQGQHFAHQQQVMQEHQWRQQQHHQQQQQQQQEQHRHNSFSSSRDLFPFLHNKVQQQHPQYPLHPSQLHHQQHLHLPTLTTQQRPSQPHQVHIPAQPQHRGISPASASAPRSKQASGSRSTPPLAPSTQTQPSTSTPPPNGASSSSNGTRNASTTANGVAKRLRSSTSPAIISSSLSHHQQVPPPKQTLLSPSQKKANHIQSEQKRRANIRRGYEALCETVPALREAIREEEEAERNAANGQRGAGGGGGGGAQRKKGRGKKGQKDGDDKEKDRLDGRAGPRSENVVLSKTIDHIQALLADRSSLLARLHRARSSLPPGHPALTPVMPDPPWEREWKGGEGRLGDEDPDGDGGSDGDEDVDDGE
ncbi:hypothetical protein BDZ97DRAFT_1783575, partial [Flammula alnicola]